MMKVLNIAKFDLLKLFREKTTLPFLVLMPIILTFVMGLAMGGNSSNEERRIPVGISSYDNSVVGKSLLEEIKKDKTLETIEYKETELIDKVKNANVEIGFIIPEDFGKDVENGKVPEINVFKLPTSTDYMAIEGIINGAYLKLQAEKGTKAYFDEKLRSIKIAENNMKIVMLDIGGEVKSNLEKPSLISVETSRYSGKSKSENYNGKAQSSIGFAVMFVMFTLILSAGEILDEKKHNTWGRLSITPTGKSTVIIGKILGTFLRGWVQIILLILFGKLVMGVSWGNSLSATIALMSVYLLSITSLGLFLSSLVKTNAQLGAISSIFIICTSMLSGCYWSVEIMPQSMQKISMVFPQYWAMKGLTNTVVGNMGYDSITTPLLVLGGIGLAFFILSIFGGGFTTSTRNNVPAAVISIDKA